MVVDGIPDFCGEAAVVRGGGCDGRDGWGGRLRGGEVRMWFPGGEGGSGEEG